MSIRTSKKTVLTLDTWKIPDVPRDLEDKVLARIQERERSSLFNKIVFLINRLCQNNYIKLPLEGFAVILLIFASLILYRGFSAKKIDDTVLIPKEFQVILNEVEHPILIETKDFSEGLDIMKDIVQEYHDNILQTIRLQNGAKVTVHVKDERGFLKKLFELGEVHSKQEGYKDSQGNIVIILKE